MKSKLKTNGGHQSRIGEKLHKELSEILAYRQLKHGQKGKLNTEILTNLITRHTECWAIIKNGLIDIPMEEVNELRKKWN